MIGVNRKAAGALFVAGILIATAGCASRVVQPEASPATESSAERIATLQRALKESAHTITGLQTEIAQLRKREEELTNSLKEAIRERTGQPPLPASAKMATPPDSAQIAAMKKDLEHERKRRSELEEQLTRLKSETSGQTFSGASAQSKEIEQLRGALAYERAAHKRLLREVVSLREKSKQVGVAEVSKGNATTSESRALRARLMALEKRHQEVMTSMARTVAADRTREEALAAELAKAREQAAAAQARPMETANIVPATDGNLSQVERDNARLRSMLEEERQRNARLAAKLKLAGRVTDLIFKMQSQPAESAAPVPPPQ